MPTSCCAFNCTRRHRKGKRVGFHRIPKEPERRSRWIAAIRRDRWKPTRGTRLCGLHFVSGTVVDLLVVLWHRLMIILSILKAVLAIYLTV